MATIAVTDADFKEKVLGAELPVLVDFWAEWCGPCQMAGPVLEALSEEYAGKVTIAKMDVDHNQLTPGQFGVMGIPTVVLLQNGKEVDRVVGFRGKNGYVQLMSKVL